MFIVMAEALHHVRRTFDRKAILIRIPHRIPDANPLGNVTDCFPRFSDSWYGVVSLLAIPPEVSRHQREEPEHAPEVPSSQWEPIAGSALQR